MTQQQQTNDARFLYNGLLIAQLVVALIFSWELVRTSVPAFVRPAFLSQPWEQQHRCPYCKSSTSFQELHDYGMMRSNPIASYKCDATDCGGRFSVNSWGRIQDVSRR